MAVAVSLLAILVVANGAGALRASSASPSHPAPSSSAFGLASSASGAGCGYTVSLEGTTPVARSQSGAEVVDSGTDAAAFINSLLAPHETYCIEAGDYDLTTDIHIDHLQGVTLSLASGAVMKSSTGSGLLLIDESTGTTVNGGDWIGLGRGRVSAIRVALGSNGTVIEHADVSRSARDGILIYDNLRPSFNVSILDNVLHDNRRFGVQVFSNATTGLVGTTISGNTALDNYVGGIYTNGVAGVSVLHNVVSNSGGDGPGEIGIGVTNGYNDTVSMNQVENMTWYGIQAYYNNHTVISYNISTHNAGGGDQSGITNDHSSYDTILGNVVESNGDYGVYLERSWNVTVSGNVANDNLGYGIGLYHGTLPVMGRVTITGNSCSFNGLGGIILNSAVDDVISTNVCYNNSDDGILLYNDPGQAGSTGNFVAGNWVGNQGSSTQTQAFGIREANGSDGNMILSNSFVNNTAASISLVGTDADSP